MVLLLKEDSALDALAKLTKQPNLIDIMVDVEDYLDNSNLYVFDNWIKGVLVRGPVVRKYWIEITLKYERKQMPDPEGALRLTPHGTQVKFEKAQELRPEPIRDPSDYEPGTMKPKMKPHDVWLVHMCIPRRFVEAVNQDLLDQYDEEAEDAETAEDQIAQGAPQGAPTL
jgi:hypothetical protein